MKIVRTTGETRRRSVVIVRGDLESFGVSLTPEWEANIGTGDFRIEFTRDEMAMLVSFFTENMKEQK